MQVLHFDNLIVGAGPAGVQLGYFFKKDNVSYCMLEANDTAGSFFAKFPRCNRLISINKKFNLFTEDEFNFRHDWNSLINEEEPLGFQKYSDKLYPPARKLAEYINDFAHKHELNIHFKTKATKIERWNITGFKVETESGQTYTCDRIFLATGAVLPNIPKEIEGIEHALGYEEYQADPALYENKRIAILGAGNSAFEVANWLQDKAAYIHVLTERPVRHAWDTHFVGDLRAVNASFLDMYQLKSLHATLGFRPVKLEPNDDGTLRMTIEEDLPHWRRPGTTTTRINYDYVIRATGWNYVDSSIFDENVMPQMDKEAKYPLLDERWETTVPNMYYIGAAMASRDRKAASGFVHGFRHNIQVLYNMIRESDYETPLPTMEFPLDTEQDLVNLSNFLIQRISTNAGLYQLNGFLCDAMVLHHGKMVIYPELPVEYAKKRFASEKNLIISTLEYGFHKYDQSIPSNHFIHPADQDDTRCSAFLHPIYRFYSESEFKHDMELGESLIVRYDIYDYEENIDHVHSAMLNNFINSIAHVTTKKWDETKYVDGIFEPWDEETIAMKVKETHGQEGATCKFMV